MEAKAFEKKACQGTWWDKKRELGKILEKYEQDENERQEEGDEGEDQEAPPLVERYTTKSAEHLLKLMEQDAKQGDWASLNVTSKFVFEFAQGDEDHHHEVVRAIQTPLSKTLCSVFGKLFSPKTLDTDPGAHDPDKADENGGDDVTLDEVRIKVLKVVASTVEEHQELAKGLAEGVLDVMQRNLFEKGAEKRNEFLSADVALQAMEAFAAFMKNGDTFVYFCSPASQCDKKFTTILDFAWKMAPWSVAVLSRMLTICAASAKMCSSNSSAKNPVLLAVEKWVRNSGHFNIGDDLHKAGAMFNRFNAASQKESAEEMSTDLEALEDLMFESANKGFLRLHVPGLCIGGDWLNAHQAFATDRALTVVLRPDGCEDAEDDETIHLDYERIHSVFIAEAGETTEGHYVLIKTQAPYPVSFYEHANGNPSKIHFEFSDWDNLNRLRDLFNANAIKVGICNHFGEDAQSMQFTNLTLPGDQSLSQSQSAKRSGVAIIDQSGVKVDYSLNSLSYSNPQDEPHGSRRIAEGGNEAEVEGEMKGENGMEDANDEDPEPSEQATTDDKASDASRSQTVDGQKGSSQGEDYASWDYGRLKKECTKFGLGGKGKKDELVARLSQKAKKSPDAPAADCDHARKSAPIISTSHTCPMDLNPSPPRKTVHKKDAPQPPKARSAPKPAASQKPGKMSDFDFPGDDEEDEVVSSKKKEVSPKKKEVSPKKDAIVSSQKDAVVSSKKDVSHKKKPSPPSSSAPSQRSTNKTAPKVSSGRTRRSVPDEAKKSSQKSEEEKDKETMAHDFDPPAASPPPPSRENKPREGKRKASGKAATKEEEEEEAEEFKAPAAKKSVLSKKMPKEEEEEEEEKEEEEEEEKEEEEEEEEEFKVPPAKKSVVSKKAPPKPQKDAPRLEMEVSSTRTSSAAKKGESTRRDKPPAKKGKSDDAKASSSKYGFPEAVSDDDDDHAPERGLTDSNLSKLGTIRKKPLQQQASPQQQQPSRKVNKVPLNSTLDDDEDLSDGAATFSMDHDDEDGGLQTPLQPTQLGFGEETPLAGKRKRSPKMDSCKSVEHVSFNLRGGTPLLDKIARMVAEGCNKMAKKRRLEVSKKGAEMEAELGIELEAIENRCEAEIKNVKRKFPKQTQALQAMSAEVCERHAATYQEYKSKMSEVYKSGKGLIESVTNVKTESKKRHDRCLSKIRNRAAKVSQQCQAEVKKLQEKLQTPQYRAEDENQLIGLINKLFADSQ